MKLFLRFLRQRLPIYIIFVSFGITFAVSFLLFRLPLQAVIYPLLVCVCMAVIATLIDFSYFKTKHKKLIRIKGFTDIIEQPLCVSNNVIFSDYEKIITLLNQEYIDFSNDKEKEFLDMVDYYSLWAHQIKTPIASIKLNLQNNDSELSRKLSAELYRIEQYVEMVLTFLRLKSDSTDYVFREYCLDDIIKGAVKNFSQDFIAKKIALKYEPCRNKVITDEKWLSFVINQVLSNALKYTKRGSITVSTSDDNKLTIIDTGIGIAPNDLPRVFEKGYTGFNGRFDKKASGLGLYLCRRICANLGHNISINSTLDKGTIVIIDLAQKKIKHE